MPKRRGTGPLTEQEQAAWRAVVRAVMILPRTIEVDLLADSKLDLAEYTVMSHLSEQVDRSCRTNDLAAAAAISAARLTAVLGRLEQQRLVRLSTPDLAVAADLVTLTDAGLHRLEEAYPAHVASVRRRVFDHFGDVDLQALTAALNAIPDR